MSNSSALPLKAVNNHGRAHDTQSDAREIFYHGQQDAKHSELEKMNRSSYPSSPSPATAHGPVLLPTILLNATSHAHHHTADAKHEELRRAQSIHTCNNDEKCEDFSVPRSSSHTSSHLHVVKHLHDEHLHELNPVILTPHSPAGTNQPGGRVHHGITLTGVRHHAELQRVNSGQSHSHAVPEGAEFFIQNAHATQHSVRDIHHTATSLNPVHQPASYANDHHVSHADAKSAHAHHELPAGTEFFIQNAHAQENLKAHSPAHSKSPLHRFDLHSSGKELSPVHVNHHHVGSIDSPPSLIDKKQSHRIATTPSSAPATTIFHSFVNYSMDADKPISVKAHNLGEDIPLHTNTHPHASAVRTHSNYFDEDELVVLEDQISDVTLVDPVATHDITHTRHEPSSPAPHNPRLFDDDPPDCSFGTTSLPAGHVLEPHVHHIPSEEVHVNYNCGILDDDELVVLQDQIVDIPSSEEYFGDSNRHDGSHTRHEQTSPVLGSSFSEIK